MLSHRGLGWRWGCGGDGAEVYGVIHRQAHCSALHQDQSGVDREGREKENMVNDKLTLIGWDDTRW